jgi:biopolymer transport protein ExbD
MRRKTSGRERLRERLSRPGGLRMTSMMDILTVLLLFLLKSFVVDGEAQTPPPGVELPKSTAAAAPEASLVIAIDHDAIMVNSEKIASVQAAVNDPRMLIEPLDIRLGAVRDQMAELASYDGGVEKEHIVTIQGDRAIEFRVLEKVMYTLQQNGFEHIALAVLKT